MREKKTIWDGVAINLFILVVFLGLVVIFAEIASILSGIKWIVKTKKQIESFNYLKSDRLAIIVYQSIILLMTIVFLVFVRKNSKSSLHSKLIKSVMIIIGSAVLFGLVMLSTFKGL